MSEHENFDPLRSESDLGPRNVPQVDLANLYIFTDDPRGVAALPENVEYDIKEELL